MSLTTDVLDAIRRAGLRRLPLRHYGTHIQFKAHGARRDSMTVVITDSSKRGRPTRYVEIVVREWTAGPRCGARDPGTMLPCVLEQGHPDDMHWCETMWSGGDE